MRLLKQSSTAQELVFLMIDSSDHISGKTGLSPTVTLRKSSGSFASPAGAVSEIANGFYKVAGNATDTATLGPLLLHATGTGADPVDVEYEVVAFDPQMGTNLGLSAIPTANAGAASGLAIVGSQMDLKDAPNSTAIAAINAAVLSAITNLNNLSALINLYGSPLLEIPDSSSTSFAFTMVVRDNEGKLVDLDSSPALTAANAAGTDRSANLSAVAHPGTGRYTFTYAVSSAAAEESLRITASGTVSAEARYIEWVGAVVNYDSLTALNAIKTKTDQLTFTVANQVDVNVLDWKSATAPAMTGDAFARIGAAGAGLTALGDSRIANLDATISSRATAAGVWQYDPALFLANTIGALLNNIYSGIVAEALTLAQIYQALGSFADTILWSDTPPDPRSLAFHIWLDKFINHYVTYCLSITRTTTYYVSQSGGSDSNNGLSTGAPFKTLAKAQTVVGPNVAILFKRGDSWTGADSLNGLNDNGNAGMLIGSYGSAQYPKPFITCALQVWPVLCSGNGSVIQSLHGKNTGTVQSGNGGAFALGQGTTGVGLCIDCDGEAGGKHCIWSIGSGTGFTGGIRVFKNCTAGGNLNPAGGAFINFNDSGGETVIYDGCVATTGSPNGRSPAIFGHEGTGQGAMFISRNLRVRAGANPFGSSVDFAYGPTATTIGAARAWEVGTRMDKQVGGTALLTQSNMVHLNCHWSVKPPDEVFRSMQYITNGWAINCTMEVDLANIATGVFCFYTTYLGGPLTGAPQIEYSRIHFSNVACSVYMDDLTAQGLSGYNRFAGGLLKNSIITSDAPVNGSHPPGAYLGMQGVTSDANALWGILSDAAAGITPGANDAMTHRIDLTVFPNVDTDPLSTSQLYGVAQPFADGIPLGYDQDLRPRSLTAPNVGPVEGNTRLISVAGALTNGSVVVGDIEPEAVSEIAAGTAGSVEIDQQDVVIS